MVCRRCGKPASYAMIDTMDYRGLTSDFKEKSKRKFEKNGLCLEHKLRIDEEVLKKTSIEQEAWAKSVKIMEIDEYEIWRILEG